ncbi:uncharacterized protein LOC117303879 [Asterias rubens]|uniref:uncharacterized protein LOC117303879 n=1 Tax=Asterias rubens TaxID=7604 RepID=UPI00145579BC|nr:uncharacterized protein LOC117303879 [Asterias rubens]XP_033644174.1 uncharacterized protein LOC117303879 [Asterias rubens]
MTDGQGSTERHYRRLLDKLKSRSSRIFVKAQMQNRTQETKLKTVVKILEKDRDLRIRKAHEGIWKVTDKACPVPRLEKTEGLPSYLSSRPRATTLPTPGELASLLPKKRVIQRQCSAEPIRENHQPPKEYSRISKRKLSTMTPDQVQIRHYRKVLNDWEQRLETTGEETAEKPEVGDHVGGLGALEGSQKEASQKKPIETDGFSTVADSSAAEESVRMVMRKLGMRPQSSPLYYSSQRTKPRKKRPQTSIGTQCDTIIEQKYESKSKVLKTNYLDMYKMQMKNHVTRMKTKGVMPAPSIRVDESAQQKPAKSTAGMSRATTPSKSPSKFAAAPFIPETRGIKTPAKMDTRSSSTLMQQTASSSLRKTPRMRRASKQLMNMSAFDQLHDEVKQIQSYRGFRRESLQVDDPDVANMDDVEDGELFEEMKRCRYIRWTKDDEAIIEEMNENEPLQSQLALLTLKYTPEKTPSKKKTAWETMQSDVN